MLQFSDLVKVFIDRTLKQLDLKSIVLDRDAVIQEFKSLGWTNDYTKLPDRFLVAELQFLEKEKFLYKKINRSDIYRKIHDMTIQTKWPEDFELESDQTIIFTPRMVFGDFNVPLNWYGNDEKTVLTNLGVGQVTVELPEPLVTFPIPPFVLAIQEYDFGAELIGQTCFLSEAKIEAANYIQQFKDMGLLDS
jgi:hypothetical protein